MWRFCQAVVLDNGGNATTCKPKSENSQFDYVFQISNSQTHRNRSKSWGPEFLKKKEVEQFLDVFTTRFDAILLGIAKATGCLEYIWYLHLGFSSCACTSTLSLVQRSNWVNGRKAITLRNSLFTFCTNGASAAVLQGRPVSERKQVGCRSARGQQTKTSNWIKLE